MSRSGRNQTDRSVYCIFFRRGSGVVPPILRPRIPGNPPFSSHSREPARAGKAGFSPKFRNNTHRTPAQTRSQGCTPAALLRLDFAGVRKCHDSGRSRPAAPMPNRADRSDFKIKRREVQLSPGSAPRRRTQPLRRRAQGGRGLWTLPVGRPFVHIMFLCPMSRDIFSRRPISSSFAGHQGRSGSSVPGSTRRAG